MGSTCSTSGPCESGATPCESSSCSSDPCSGRCPACSGNCGGDPVACAMAMWAGSFFQAMKAAQVDVLKAKIQKAWGTKMDKAADIVIEAMGVKWQSMVAEAKAKAEVREKLQRLWQESK